MPLTVVVNDTHRNTDTRSFIMALVEALDAEGGLGDELRLRLLVAAGSHRSTPEERRRHEETLLGAERRRFAEIEWHDARDERRLKSVGSYRFHHWMAEAGFYLACGSVEPHYFAGLTGSHKTLTVGVMSIGDLTANHETALGDGAMPLNLSGNPVHEGVAAALVELEASGARLLACNQILVSGRLVDCRAGHPIDLLQQCLPTIERHYARRCSGQKDLVIARVGPPLNRDFYQAHKGIMNTERAVRDGGLMILEAACPLGVGLSRWLELLKEARTHADTLTTIRRQGYRLGDHKAVAARRLQDLRQVRLALVTDGVDPELAEAIGVAIFRNRRDAAAWATDALGPQDQTGVLVEDAGCTVVGVD